MSDYKPNLNYRKCKWCGHKPLKDVGKYCTKCGKPYKDVYTKEEEETMPKGFLFKG